MYSAGERPDRENTRVFKENGPESAGQAFDLLGAPTVRMTERRSVPVSGPTASQPTTVVSTEPESPHELLSSALHEAADSIAALELGIAEAAATFRHGTPDEASVQLLRVIDTLRLLTILAGIVARTVHVDLASIRAHDGTREPVGEMGVALDQLTAHQFAENWIGVADTLESSVVSALSGWREVFAVLQIEADVKLGARIGA